MIYAADDFITRIKIPRRSDQNPVNAWSFNEWDEVHYLRPAPPTPRLDEIEKLFEERAATLNAKIASLEGELRRLVQQKGK